MITVENLTKQYKIAERSSGLSGAVKGLFARKYRVKTAVDSINLQIQRGEMVGYIGANGAGKSTTIKMLSGILTPTSGTISVNGVIPYKDRQKNAMNIGAVFGQRTQLFWDIPVRESYHLLKHIYEIPDDSFQKTMKLFTDVLDLDKLLGIPVRQLSLGQKMRCELAAAFLHSPSVVYLDEPTIGLDVAVKTRIREFIKEMNSRSETTVLLTTHDMQDIEELTKRIVIIDEGQILYDGDLKAVQERFGHRRTIHFDINPDENVELPEFFCGKAEILPSTDYDNDNRVSISFSSQDLSASDVISAMLNKYVVRDLTITDPKIESIVKEIYERGM